MQLFELCLQLSLLILLRLQRLHDLFEPFLQTFCLFFHCLLLLFVLIIQCPDLGLPLPVEYRHLLHMIFHGFNVSLSLLLISNLGCLEETNIANSLWIDGTSRTQRAATVATVSSDLRNSGIPAMMLSIRKRTEWSPTDMAFTTLLELFLPHKVYLRKQQIHWWVLIQTPL